MPGASVLAIVLRCAPELSGHLWPRQVSFLDLCRKHLRAGGPQSVAIYALRLPVARRAKLSRKLKQPPVVLNLGPDLHSNPPAGLPTSGCSRIDYAEWPTDSRLPPAGGVGGRCDTMCDRAGVGARRGPGSIVGRWVPTQPREEVSMSTISRRRAIGMFASAAGGAGPPPRHSAKGFFSPRGGAPPR